MKATFVYQERDGLIVAISKHVDLKAAGSKFESVGIIPGEGQKLIDVELSGELAEMRLRDMHRHYYVEPETSKLIKKHLNRVSREV